MSRKWPTRVGVRGFMAALAATMALIVATPSGAHAATDVLVSGSTYSSSEVWYTSTNYRTISSDWGGYVYINPIYFPKLSGGASDQLKWRLVTGGTESNIKYLYQVDTNYNLGHWSTGTQFRNKYARYTTCNNCDHDFAATMDY